jgi:glycosyltransferase involved in cell wall biosynthesis
MVKAVNSKNFPVIINNRNRVTSLKALVESLEKAGMQNIFIIDNASTYEPLLKYYQETPHSIFHLKENVGYLAFWELGIWERFKTTPYVYTDSDVVPVEECPDDYLDVFWDGLKRYPDIQKIGFSLEIDDLPDHYIGKSSVIRHERQFWEKKYDSYFFDSLIDTTFALYRPSARGGVWERALRSPEPYIARHIPWYVNSSQLSEEEKFYRDHASKDSSWTAIDNQIILKTSKGNNL